MALDKHDYAKDSLKMHYEAKGKIEVVSAVPVRNSEDLSLAYAPGVAAPCRRQPVLSVMMNCHRHSLRIWSRSWKQR